MPSSQPATAATSPGASDQRRNDKTITLEPPKLKTPLKTPPKQATNPLQFVKVGPCALYRSAQEQLSKVQEVKKVETKVKDDPEDWQSNLDNWKSSRRKRQEHIIERVVEVKKLELEEHDRNRKRSKTFSEMMEERGRKLSLSLAVYNEDDANDLSDLGIGTSSGKSSVSGDTHDDSHSVLSDRDSEIDKNHSDVDNASHENGNDRSSSLPRITPTKLPSPTKSPATPKPLPLKREVFNNGFHKNNHNSYDSAATTSSPEPDEYTRNYVTRISQGFAQKNGQLEEQQQKRNSNGAGSESLTPSPVVKVDILKRREIFEKAARENENNRNNGINNNKLEFGNTKSIKERLSILERQKAEGDSGTTNNKERFNSDKHQSNSGNGVKPRDLLLSDELESVKPLREILSNLEKCNMQQDLVSANTKLLPDANRDELNAKFIKERLISLDASRCKDIDKRTNAYYPEQTNTRAENLTPSERSSSPDSEYRAPRATFHQSLDSLDADASSGPDTFERVQSLEELDYHQSRRYPASSSSAEILNDTDREDSGIHTADASCSVSQADEPIEEEQQQQPAPAMILEEKTEFRSAIESTLAETSKSLEKVEEKISLARIDDQPCDEVLTESGTADITSSSCTGEAKPLCANNEPPRTSTNLTTSPALLFSSPPRPVVYHSPRVPPRRSPPDIPAKPSYLPVLSSSVDPAPKEESSPSDTSSTNTVCSTVSPLPSPRSPSKIPTPLPRKSISNPASPQSPPPVLRHKTSLPTSPRSPETDAARRLTVVEVCERLVVPRGQAQVTPFIVVERLAVDEVDNAAVAASCTEVRVTDDTPEHKLCL